MRGRRKFFPVFVGFFLLSLLIFIFSQKGLANGVTGVLQTITLPIQRYSFSFFHSSSGGDENIDLRMQAAKVAALEKDNQALRDQFAVINPSSKTLIPAFIVGMPAFLPGISIVDEIIIDKGSDDKIKPGSSIVFKDNLIGKIVKTSPHLSVVDLLNHKGFSFTAKTTATHALGIMQGTGTETIVLNNVLLSDTLQKGDIVVTKGDINSDGLGFPPDLIIGKIISINKKASALFQSAEVERLVDVTRLEMVFVMMR
ncbi:rod shape-determining protein MreC [Patescibacteria group bacterium]|nr:rod shape-determining protein MreC [Patescibacteria group bacterium]